MPRTTLLIATFNRTALLRDSLNRLSQLTLPDDILIVDDGGSDNCDEMCADMANHLPLRYLYTHNPVESQCSHARNVGIKHTDAEIVITSEPEMIFNSDVIAQLLADYEERPREVISAGRVNHQQKDGYIEINSTPNWNATWVALYKRQWLLDIGGWDEGFPNCWGWEDVDLLTRLRVSGHGHFIDPAIEATHMWHPYRYFNIDQSINEGYFKAKQIDEDHWDLVANPHQPWGEIKPR